MTAALLLAAWTLRSSLLLGLAWLAVAGLRRRTAALRHRVLATAVLGALALPLLSLVVPAWRVAPAAAPAAVVQPLGSARAPEVATTLAFRPAAGVTATGPALPARSFPGGPGQWLLAAWLAGSLTGVCVLAVALLRLRHDARRATVVASGPWRDALDAMQADGTTPRVEILQSRHPSWLFTWGVRRPRIVLPAGAGHWSPARIAVVLAHEVEHVRRRDWAVQLAGELLRALAWFNPLAWVVASRLTLESEHACDDAVVAAGVEPSVYAVELVDLALTLVRSPVWLPAPAMARASSLERRIHAMLDPGTQRHRLSRPLRLAVTVAGLAMTAAIASLAAQTQFATLNGTVRDQLGGTLPRVTLRMTHALTGARHEITTTPAGTFEFVGLPPGNYTLETMSLGFKGTSDTLQLAGGQTLRRDLRLEVGTLQETITVVDRPSPAASSSRGARSAPRPVTACTAEPNSGGIKPPTKTVDRRPVFPASMRGLTDDAKVEMKAIIGIDGAVKTVETLSAPSDDFARSAEEAVRQWRFTPTLLNCVPIEVEMHVLTLFKAEPPAPPAPPPPPPAPPAPPVR